MPISKNGPKMLTSAPNCLAGTQKSPPNADGHKKTGAAVMVVPVWVVPGRVKTPDGEPGRGDYFFSALRLAAAVVASNIIGVPIMMEA